MRRGEYDEFTDEDLRREFSKYGTVTRAEMTVDKESGWSKGAAPSVHPFDPGFWMTVLIDRVQSSPQSACPRPDFIITVFSATISILCCSYLSIKVPGLIRFRVC